MSSKERSRCKFLRFFSLVIASTTLLIAPPSLSASSHGVLYPLREIHRGEEAYGVHYYSDRELELLEVSVSSDGRLIRKLGETPIQSLAKGTPSIFVISPEGKMYLAIDPQMDFIHHSSLAKGGAVSSAGEALVVDGKILALSLKSGHYHPGVEAKKVLEDWLRDNHYRSPYAFGEASVKEAASSFANQACTQVLKRIFP